MSGPLIDFLLERVPYPKLAYCLGQTLSECDIHARLHKKTIHAHAGLAGIAKLRCHRTLHCRVEIGVVEHNERRVTAKFQ